MAEPMTLRDEDLGRIGEYVKPWLRELVDEVVTRPEPAGADARLLERMVRVEVELKAQRTLMDERFGFMATRFEAVDKRFEELIGHTNARFEESHAHTNARFTELAGQMNARFRTQTWMIGVGFGVITSLTTLFALLS